MIALNMRENTPEYPIRILHLEDSEIDHQLVCRALSASGLTYEISRVDTLDAFQEATTATAADLILADYRLQGFTALDAWESLQGHGRPPPFILLSGAIGEAAAVAAIHQGITDYLHKDELTRLGRVVRRSLQVFSTQVAKDHADMDLAASEKRVTEFANHLQSAIEMERAAIAREIHDDIGGSLAAVKLDLAWISRHSTADDIRSHIHAATEMLQHALGASQRIMMNLRPAILDQGLCPSIQWLSASFEKRTGIETTLRVSHEHVSAGKLVELTAYRTAQEALTNVSKYAKCSRVQIDLSDEEGVLTLEISDNGQGIKDFELRKPQSFGIVGLRERARMVGGWLDVSSTLGVGTSIILSVPLKPSAQFSDGAQLK